MSKFSNKNRILALVAALAIIFLVLFSTSITVEHHTHVCTDHHCPICYVIAQAQENLNNIGAGLALTAFAVALVFAAADAYSLNIEEPVQATLVSQKVRIDS